jgi:hypothetical protein
MSHNICWAWEQKAYFLAALPPGTISLLPLSCTRNVHPSLVHYLGIYIDAKSYMLVVVSTKSIVVKLISAFLFSPAPFSP